MLQLRDYQKTIANEALNKLKNLGIVYLALQTRTGKTLTALHIAELSGAKKVLFVTKLKAIGSIEADYKSLNPVFDLTVINYESVLKVADMYDLAIIDEAHSLGSFPKPSKRFKELKAIVYNIPVILMSATPSPESYSQLYHQFTINRFHSWNRAGNFYKWAKVYTTQAVKYFYGREIKDYSQAIEPYISKATKDYFINLTQEEAGFTQVIDETILRCTMSLLTYELMRKLKADKVAYYNERAILVDTAVKEMSKMHQLSSGTCIYEEGDGVIVDASKADYIKKYFVGQKIAIFYKFKQEFELLKATFSDYTEKPEEFQEGNRTFLGQFQSAREGIRLDTADALIFFNIDFSYLSYQQSRNRIISKERDRRTPLYFVFAHGGIEEKIYKVVLKKGNYTSYHYRKDYGS